MSFNDNYDEKNIIYLNLNIVSFLERKKNENSKICNNKYHFRDVPLGILFVISLL